MDMLDTCLSVSEQRMLQHTCIGLMPNDFVTHDIRRGLRSTLRCVSTAKAVYIL